MFRPRYFPAAAILAFCVLALAMFSKMPEEALTGSARAIDGDSVLLNGREMRLKGLDAPEARQTCSISGQDIPCGRQATQALAKWFSRGLATCTGREIDRYGRLLVICRVNGVDIGADLVRQGFAFDYGGYPDEEREAARAYRGIWAGTFERPEAYRRRMRDEKAP